MAKQTNTLTIAEEFALKISEEKRKAKIIQLAPVIVLFIFITSFSIVIDGFFSVFNLMAILRQLSIPLILALGITFVILMGSIDLSIEGVMGLAGSAISLLILNNKNTMNLGLGGVILILIFGMLVGLTTGLIHVKLRLPSFIVTFGISNITAGIALLIYRGIPATITDTTFINISRKEFLLLPIMTWIALVVFGIAYVLQEYTGFGRYVYAIGDNENIPRVTGVNVDRVKLIAFAWSGFCVALAGIIGASRLGRGEVLIGKDNLFPAITAVVVGGTALSGGKGGVVNTLLGALIVTILQNGLILLGVDPYIQNAIQGIIIVAAVAFSVIRGNKIITK